MKMWRRWSLFLLSILTMGLGISMVSLTQLGTTAITSPAFVMSSLTGLTFGNWTIIFNFTYIMGQLVLLGRRFPKHQYLQIIVSLLLGMAIDGWSSNLSFISSLPYLVKITVLVVGCFVIALSTIWQLEADIVNNPAEGIVKALASKTKKTFGKVKVLFDGTLVAVAVILSLVFLQQLIGVREGTVISVLLIGQFITAINNRRNQKHESRLYDDGKPV
ncbi:MULTISPECIES: YczE/YyaS/YitT family protein [unclassified Jeotgalibaca]|uniref:YczE/YyaS/YitT family protein n=1 Tax=unclassified Jeotgalibaca TaxID=2621505 RepID=UPI003FCEFE3E